MPRITSQFGYSENIKIATLSQNGGTSADSVAYNLDTDELARQYEEKSGKAQYETGVVLLGDLAINPGAHVLDIGCGTGLVAAHAASLVGADGRVVGIDPLTKRIDLARKKITSDLKDTLSLSTAWLRTFPDLAMKVLRSLS